MPRQYSPDGLVISETFSHHVDLHVWLNDMVNIHLRGRTTIWNVLQEKGKYFANPLKAYPTDIAIPERVERGCCHQNNLLYARILLDTHRDILERFRFVTGLWLREANNINSFSNTNYCIGPHSFLTYQGDVLDCGAITNPPDFYKISQYFGISFEIQYALNAYDDLEKAGIDTGKVPIIEVLHGAPNLSKAIQ